MDGEKFRKIIQSGTGDYGSEIWFFLRELAQNSRDADADYIRVTTGYLNNDTEFIRFEDNGIGMSKNHADDYLFKLFASSKENQGNSIGKYGIGFWTVLKFEPYKIIIESKFKKEKWAIQLNTKLEIEPIPTTIKKCGTIITLLRIGKFDKPEKYINTVKTEIIKYCKYLTKKKAFKPLPVIFNDELINQKMELPGILSKKIDNKNLEGLVGLAKEPKIMLYAKGLPVWTGSVLSDLTDHSKNSKARFETGKGLAPVFLLNSSNLDINFSRNVPIDNANLTKMINIAENELSKLIFSFIKSTTPWSLFYSLNEIIKKTITGIKKSLFLKLLIVLVFLIPLEIYLLNYFFSKNGSENISKSDLVELGRSNPGNKASSALSVKDEPYSGASVQLSKDSDIISISYTPKNRELFKLYPANIYDTKRGFVYTAPDLLNILDSQSEKKGITFRIENAQAGKSFLLSKNNFRIDIDNIKINGKIIDRNLLEYFDDNSMQINLTNDKNLIEYKIYPLKNKNILSETNRSKYLKLPISLTIPDPLLTRLKAIENQSIMEKIEKIEVLTRELLKYDSSENIIEQYRLDQNSNWLTRVLRIKAGDCDVINGVNTLLLRKIQIPARLVIGFIGKDGKIDSNLHAWTEYYRNGWQTIDVSTIIQPPVNNIQKTQTQKKLISPGNEIKDNETSDQNGIVQIILIVFFVLFFVFLFIFILKLQKNKKTKKNIDTMTKSLSEIAVNALIFPEIWKSMYVWNYKFIPTIGNKYISLANILHQAKQGFLFKSSDDNPLLSNNSIKNLFILDINDRYYSNLIMTIPGIIDLDGIRDLEIKKIEETEIIDPEIRALLKQAEALLDKATNSMLKVFISSNFNKQSFMNIKLSKYIYPNLDQFVLINPECCIIDDFIKDSSRNIKYLIFKFIEKILENFDLQQSEIILINKRISKLLLKMEI